MPLNADEHSHRPKLTAILHREEDVYVAECPEVGAVSQGDTVEEALANLREATELFLEECPQPAPPRCCGGGGPEATGL